MKKLVLIIMALVLAITSIAVFADGEEAPTVKLSGFYFSSVDVPAYGSDEAAALAPDHEFDYSTIAQAYGSDTLTSENGVMTYVGGTGYLSINTVTGQIDGSTDVWHDPNHENAIENYKFFAYKIENASSAAVESALILQIACSDGAHSGEIIVNDVMLYNTDGTEATDVTYSIQDKFSNGQNRGYLNIPAGKTVWVVVPMTATNIPLFEADAENGALSLPADQNWTGIEDYMNMYLHAYQTTLNWAPVVDQPSDDVTDEPSDDVTDEPSADVTDEPSDDVTEAPSDDAGENPDDSTDTADLSVIAYAAAAITGLGALVVAKKR